MRKRMDAGLKHRKEKSICPVSVNGLLPNLKGKEFRIIGHTLSSGCRVRDLTH